MKWSEIKKGQMIYEIISYNFFFNDSRNNYDPVTKTYGNWKSDEIQIRLWVVHSIGKKVMKLMNTEGVMKKSASYSQFGFSEKNYHNSFEEAFTMAKKLHAEDKHETKQPLTIKFIQTPTRW